MCWIWGGSAPELKEVWHLVDTSKNDQFHYSLFAQKIDSFDTAPKKLLASDSHLRPDIFPLKWVIYLGRVQKRAALRIVGAEKRNREAYGVKFILKWFELTEEVTTTPWGELEVYQFNGKYVEHRTAIDRQTL
ncbi:oxysterol-binding protein-related protein 3C-like [Silene latifolia]|uniref:oxysterol-binding protein-related protein 3C-like n=1 Tax=Silene latifolia TaxID=37657 RepID=UPI003D777D47